MTPPTKNGHAQLPIESRKRFQFVVPYFVRTWWVFLCWKLGKKVLKSEDTVSINDSDNEIADDGQDVRKVMASETLDILDVVKCFAKIHGDKQLYK